MATYRITRSVHDYSSLNDRAQQFGSKSLFIQITARPPARDIQMMHFSFVTFTKILLDTLQEQAAQTHTSPHNDWRLQRSEEHTSELQSLMHISYAVFCLKKIKEHTNTVKYTT